MNIAILHTIIQDDLGDLKDPHFHDRGLAGFSHMFPMSKFWYVGIKGFEKVKHAADLVIVAAAADPEQLEAIAAGLSDFKGIKLIQDFDVPIKWNEHNKIFELIKHFKKYDAVVTHTPHPVDALRTWSPVPVFWLGEVNVVASYKETFLEPDTKRDIVLLPYDPTRFDRNIFTSYAIAKGIHKRLACDSEKYRFMTIASKDKKEGIQNLLRRAGMEFFEIKTISDKMEINHILNRTALFINMDTSPCIGHWNIEAAALCAPMLITRNSAMGAFMGEDVYATFDMELAMEAGIAKLTGCFPKDLPAKETVFFSAAAVRNTLLENLKKYNILPTGQKTHHEVNIEETP